MCVRVCVREGSKERKGVREREREREGGREGERERGEGRQSKASVRVNTVYMYLCTMYNVHVCVLTFHLEAAACPVLLFCH